MTTIQNKAHAIWVDVYKQLGEIADQTGCEAGARRAFHDGRFAALKELGLLGEDNAVASDEMIEKRRRELDEALRPEATRQQMAFEPIVRRLFGQHESTEATEAEDAAVEEPADEDAPE